MSSAYLYAEDSANNRQPAELRLLWAIDRFGVKAVLGRDTLTAAEISRMTAAENVYKAYRGREASVDENGNPNWAKWAMDNPKLSELLNYAIQIAHEERGVNG